MRAWYMVVRRRQTAAAADFSCSLLQSRFGRHVGQTPSDVKGKGTGAKQVRATTNTRVRYFGIRRGRPRVDSDTLPPSPARGVRQEHSVLRRLAVAASSRGTLELSKVRRKDSPAAAASRRALLSPSVPQCLCARVTQDRESGGTKRWVGPWP